ncbi:MAG TPA: glycosyltransferase family 1 protein [Pseudonocardiaceae bacterium]|nr:glycosyltransferase family 1 protein [Pseudonocardiaceae bacterium]
MRIVIDVDVLANSPKTGVYYYVQRLASALLDLDRSNDYVLTYLNAANSDGEFGLPAGNARIKKVTWLPRTVYHLLLRTPFAPPFDLVTGTAGDIFVFTKFVRWPLLRRSKSLVVVYDTTYLDTPEAVENWHFRRYLRWAVPRSIRRASQVIAISESTKRSLMRHYGTSADKISVVTPALDHTMFAPSTSDQIDAVRAKHGIDKPYILSVGTIEPRKNLVGLLRAFALTSEEFNQKYALVLVGGKGWLDEQINELYEQLSKRMTIIRTGYVPSDELPALYSGASVFVYPSLFEGFGMPPLEAMACGTPVITADNSSLPEVVGDAGILVEATDAAQLAREMQELLADPERAAELRAKGLARAQSFTWEASAKELLGVMNDVAAKG